MSKNVAKTLKKMLLYEMLKRPKMFKISKDVAENLQNV